MEYITTEELIGNRFSNYNTEYLNKFDGDYPTLQLSNNILLENDSDILKINFTFNIIEALTNLTYININEFLNYLIISHRYQDSILLFLNKTYLHKLFKFLDIFNNNKFIKNMIFIGIGGFNSHIIFFYVRLYLLLKSAFQMCNEFKTNNNNTLNPKDFIFYEYTLFTPSQLRFMYELYKFKFNKIPKNIIEMYNSLYGVIKKYFSKIDTIIKLLNREFNNKRFFIFENDELEFSNLLRFPVIYGLSRDDIQIYDNESTIKLANNYRPVKKIKYFEDILKYLNLDDMFKFLCSYFNTDVYVKDVDIITGAVSPVNRLKLSKLYKEKFIFNGHFNNEFEITNDYRIFESLTEKDIFVEETYGNINIPLFLINMQSAAIDWIYVVLNALKGKIKTVSKHVKDVLDYDNTELYMIDLDKFTKLSPYAPNLKNNFEIIKLKDISKEDFDSITTGMMRDNYTCLVHNNKFYFEDKDNSFEINSFISI